MKISSASKKVLASALSAAMVVAFAPTVAFATTSAVAADKADDAAMAALGYVAKQYTPSSTAPTYTYYTATDMGTSNLTGLVTLIADVDNGITVNPGNAGLTIDLNGHTVLNDDDGLVDFATSDSTTVTERGASRTITDLDVNTASNQYVPATDAITVTGANKLTVKNGTVKAVTVNVAGQDDDKAIKNLAVYSAGAVELSGVTATGTEGAVKAAATTLNGGTYGSVVSSANVLAKGTVETGAITAASGVTAYEGAALTVKDTQTKKASTAVAGALTVQKNASADVSAVSSAAGATGVSGKLTASAQGAKAAVAATATGDTGDATAIAGGADGSDITASAASNAGAAYALKGASAVKGGTFSADGKTSKESYAAYAANGSSAGEAIAISGGTFTGKLVAEAAETTGDTHAGSIAITGGTFSANPNDFVDTASYNITYANGVYTVAKFKGFEGNIQGQDATGTGVDNSDKMAAYLKNVLEAFAAGKTVEGITFAEGVTAQTVLDKAINNSVNNKDGKVTAKLAFKSYAEKSATEAQKAGKAAIDAAVKADLSKTTDENYAVVSATIQYTADKATTPTVLATIEDMGTTASGLSTVDNNLKLKLGNAAGTVTAWGYVNGKATKMAFTDTDNDGKPNAENGVVEFRVIPTLITVSSNDPDALKNAVIKGDDTPAAEKATQGIDVDKKSKTVKLAKKATKTKKDASFNLGATAQTGLTIAKASGSSKVTVSNTGKVTLKKGAKKGTYKATVTINAASSDQYLAAAKTVTVKFVVKK